MPPCASGQAGLEESVMPLRDILASWLLLVTLSALVWRVYHSVSQLYRPKSQPAPVRLVGCGSTMAGGSASLSISN